VGALNPIYRDHTAKGTADQEPWVHGPEHEAIRRKYIELRYRLMPYIYTITEESSRAGIPLMRPIFLEYPQAAEFYRDDHDFLFGPDLFVSPVISEMVDVQGVALPPGEWFDYWTSERHTGKDQINLHPRLDEMPLYVRAGAIVPMQPLVQSTSEKPSGPLQLRAYLPTSTSGPDASFNACRGALYEDDGHTFAYQKGEILRINYSCQVAAGSVSLTSNIEKNSYRPWWNTADITFFGVSSIPKEVRIGDELSREWRYDPQAHSVTLTVPDAVKNWTVRLMQ
jgi:alpha-glucosidase